MKIRKATCKDIKELANLLAYLFDQEKEHKTDTKKQKTGLQSIIENKKIGKIFVATKQNKIVGMINLLYSVSTSLGARVGIIEDVIVLPEFRGKKIGSQLIKHAIKYAKRKNLKRITLFTDFDNQKAHKFYEKSGFTKSSMVQFQRGMSRMAIA